jgi:hypothetical protein
MSRNVIAAIQNVDTGVLFQGFIDLKPSISFHPGVITRKLRTLSPHQCLHDMTFKDCLKILSLIYSECNIIFIDLELLHCVIVYIRSSPLSWD